MFVAAGPEFYESDLLLNSRRSAPLASTPGSSRGETHAFADDERPRERFAPLVLPTPVIAGPDPAMRRHSEERCTWRCDADRCGGRGRRRGPAQRWQCRSTMTVDHLVLGVQRSDLLAKKRKVETESFVRRRGARDEGRDRSCVSRDGTRKREGWR